MNTFYISGKAGRHEGLVRMISQNLQKHGYKNSCDWTGFKIEKPFDKKLDETRKCAEQMVEAIKICDVFILISDTGLVSALIELGIALASTETNPKKKIIIFEFGELKSAFYTLHQVQIIRDVKEIEKTLLT